ncbi:G5 domain-containing protein [Isoptericola sp. NEAU-Y5]|uniref:G5 domain-containing protein n=1 Tax=Isoptericola luteus TaxID=2879484 RepID=A0ABS7ZD15_9MICO|nr:G5 domain-containing protein [Isoptericola sp. NEAU-Y5]MCA5892928.1 G5 domain-containing protein [Isoptericola sp. NEAU-Y5]
MTTSPDLFEPTPTDQARPETPARRPRRLLVAGITAAAVVAGGGAAAYAGSLKSVTLDVDGELRTVTTTAGSVDGLLEAQGVVVDTRDEVTPGADSALRDGSDVVVRSGKQLALQVDGERTDTWVTALDADEALDVLSARGSDVRIVASRSGDRASLPVDLDVDGPVAVVHDGTAHVVGDGTDVADVATALDAADVELDRDDRVHVADAAAKDVAKDVAAAQKKADEADEADEADKADGAATQAAAQTEAPEVAVVVQRVETKDVTRKVDVEHKTTTKKDSGRYADLDAKVTRKGSDGVRTVVHEVTTVDGKVVKKSKVSDEVTKKPVTEVRVKGTKKRPSTPTSSGSTRDIGRQMAAARGWSGSQWSCLESLWTKESGWDASAQNPSSGAYGIPQSLPGSKMATAGADWQTNPATQIEWGLGYISGRYGTPCAAWGHSQSVGWY